MATDLDSKAINSNFMGRNSWHGSQRSGAFLSSQRSSAFLGRTVTLERVPDLSPHSV